MAPRAPSPAPTPTPKAPETPADLTPAQVQERRQREQRLDRELDQELAQTFPASDPIPWSHEVK